MIGQITGKSAASSFIESIEQSVDTYCGVDDQGVVITLGGVMPTGRSAIGYVWQFIGPELAKHKRAYIEQSRSVMARGFTHFDYLVTCIECDYKSALRHMRRLGWSDLDAMEINGIPVRVVGVSAHG